MEPSQVEERMEQAVRQTARQNWGWLLALGIVMVVLGLAALGVPVAAAAAAALFLGWLLLLGGAVMVVQAWRHKDDHGLAAPLIGALVYLAAGVLLVAYPIAGAVTLGLVLAAYFLAGGAAKVWLALRMRPRRGWGWVLFNALVALALGVIILLGWPGDSLWVLGLFVALDLIFAGLASIGLALEARRQGG